MGPESPGLGFSDSSQVLAESTGPVRTIKYDAFISYSHAADGQFAPALRNGLQRFATPWGPLRWANPVRSLRIFQDTASLAANPALWPTIEQALAASEWFVLLASPGSAQSPWVGKEVDFWFRHKSLDRLLIVQTAGDIAWDLTTNDFDWAKTDAVTNRLCGAFHEQPRWVDARFAHTEKQATMRDPRFRDLVAELAAPLRGASKDELIGEDIRQHRRLNTWRNVALGIVGALFIGTVGAAIVAFQERDLAEQRRVAAEHQLHISEYRRLAAQSGSVNAFDLALLLAVEANRLEDNYETRHALLDALQSRVQVDSFLFGRPESGRQGVVRHVAYSPDGKMVATGGSDGTVVWDVSTRRVIEALPDVSNPAISFTSDGVRSINEVGTAVLWDPNTRNTIGQLFRTDAYKKTWIADRSAWSPDGKVLATLSDEAIILWDTKTRRPFDHPLKGRMLCVAFAPDSKTLASGSEDDSIGFWDVSTQKRKGRPLLGHTAPVWSLAFSRDGRMLASGSEDDNVRLWDVTAPEHSRARLTGHTGAVYSVAFNQAGDILASGSIDDKIRLWDVNTLKPIGQPLIGHNNAVRALAFSPHDNTLASGGDDGRIILWRPGTPRIVGRRLVSHIGAIQSLAFARNGDVLAAGGADGKVIMWDVNKDRAIGDPLVGPVSAVRSVAFGPTGETLASGSDNGGIMLWDVSTHKPVHQPLIGRAAVVHLSFKDRDHLVAYGSDHTSVTWDLKTYQTIGESKPFYPDPQPHLADPNSLGEHGSLTRLNSDNSRRTRAVGQPDGTVVLPGESEDFALKGHDRAVNTVLFSPDGNILASGSNDETIIIWDINVNSWRRRACAIANRNLARDEYEKYVSSDLSAYYTSYAQNPSCASLPIEPAPVPTTSSAHQR